MKVVFSVLFSFLFSYINKQSARENYHKSQYIFCIYSYSLLKRIAKRSSENAVYSLHTIFSFYSNFVVCLTFILAGKSFSRRKEMENRENATPPSPKDTPTQPVKKRVGEGDAKDWWKGGGDVETCF